jgi:DNA-binding GntR family transcriptional regulator
MEKQASINDQRIVGPPPLSEQAFRKLIRVIFSGSLPPGDPLVETMWAKSFGVSQSTVREAVSRLEHLGLVVRSNRGAEIINLSLSDLAERTEVRIPLDQIASVRFSRWIRNKEDRLEILENLEVSALRISDANELEGDLDFHEAIWKGSRNKTLAEMLRVLAYPVFAFVPSLRGSGLKVQDRSQRAAAHQELVDALREGDEAKIKERVGIHVKSVYEQFKSSGYPDFRTAAKASGQPTQPSGIDLELEPSLIEL